MLAARRVLSSLDTITKWQPTDLNNITWQRPSGSDYVTWESLVSTSTVNAQAASPSTPVLLTATFMKSITGQKILSLPAGIFEAENGWSHYVNNNMMGLGQGYATGLRGIVGSGSHSTPGPGGIETIIRMQGTMSGTPGQTPQGNLLMLNAVSNPYLGGFSLHGVQTRGDNVFHTGIGVFSCTGTAIVERLYLKNASPGYANYPPGETFGINIYRTKDVVVRDCEIDGRDFSGNRTCSSPLGWNSCGISGTTPNGLANTPDFKLVERVYAHHGLTGMLTFWETTNIRTEDYYVFSWSSGTGVLTGSGINHEQSGGRIRHIRPRLFVNGANSNGPVQGSYGHNTSDDPDKTASRGSTFGLATGISDAGADFEMWYPEWDNTLGSSGIICMASYDGYSLGQAVVTPPKIWLKDSNDNDYMLIKTDHPTSGWSTRDPFVYFAWIH